MALSLNLMHVFCWSSVKFHVRKCCLYHGEYANIAHYRDSRLFYFFLILLIFLEGNCLILYFRYIHTHKYICVCFIYFKGFHLTLLGGLLSSYTILNSLISRSAACHFKTLFPAFYSLPPYISTLDYCNWKSHHPFLVQTLRKVEIHGNFTNR